MPDYGDVNPETGRTNARTQFEGTVDPLAPSVSNGQITPAEWAEYQRRRRNAAIWGILGTLGGAMGGSALSYGLGGYGGAVGAGASGSASVPGAVGASSAPLGGGTVGGGVLASTPTATSLAPYAGTVAASGSGAGAGAGGAGLLAGMSARDLASLGLTGASVIGSMTQDRPDMTPNSATTDPNLAKLIQAMQGRLDQSQPLYQSILSMANGLLPTQYQNGGAGR